MVNDYVAPINHSTASAAGSTLSSTAGGALKGGAKAGISWMGVTVGIGAALGLGLATGGLGFLFSSFLWLPVVGAVAGGMLGSMALPWVAGAGAAIGGGKAGLEAGKDVKAERGAAAVLQAQVDVARAQAEAANQSATTNVYAPSATNDNKFNFPDQGSAMNMANPAGLQGGNIQYDGVVAGRELQRA